MKQYILALDQGTSSSRAIVFDEMGKSCAVAQREFRQIFPKSGWVEHDPHEIWSSQASVIAEAITMMDINGLNIAGIGITNQRETSIVWDSETEEPIYNAIVWQDRRTSDYCNELKSRGLTDMIRQKTGLIIDAYFSATKIKWILDHVPGAREKAAAGVDVRVVYDDFGCITRLPMRYAKKLREMGIRAHAFNPYVPILSARLNNRDHRKLMIIDGKAAFTGGVNLADEYINELERFGRWKDCGILVRGKAVWSMTVMFLSLWGYVDRCEEDVSRFRVACAEKQGGTGFLQPFADSPLDNEDVGATMLQSVISSAQERMWIMTPYLILDDKMTTALCVAAKTGVDVRIITPAIPDKWYVHAVTRANYEELTRAGVRIYEYTPGFIHSKVYLADSVQAVVGTVNLDFRSLYLHFEDAVYLCDTAANAQIEEDFVQTFPQCRAITYEQCRHVHLYQRILRALLRMFAPLM